MEKDKVSELFERSGIDAGQVERLDRVNVWQGFIKNAEGEIETVDLTSVQYTPRSSIDLSKLVTTAAPTLIRPSRRRKPLRSDSVSVVLPDMQIGYREDEPFHDEAAMELGLIACRELQPDNIVLLGDNLDLPTMSKFDRLGAGWNNQVQRSLNRFHHYLSQIRADNPESNLVVHWGNHDLRLHKQIIRHNGELLGLKRANAEHELGVLTLQFLLRTKELEVQTIDAYPRGKYWLEDNLHTTHGYKVRSGGNTAQAMLSDNDSSVIFGHVHRIEVATKTLTNGRIIQAVTPGTLARIDGSVPSQEHTVDESDRTVQGHDNWQQGLAVVHHNPRNHQIDVIRINQGRMNLYGNEHIWTE